MAQKRRHRHWAKDLAHGVAGSQQGNRTGKSKQSSCRQDHRADPDEGCPKEDRAEKSRDRRALSHAHSAADVCPVHASNNLTGSPGPK
jgi:hypothetical protein